VGINDEEAKDSREQVVEFDMLLAQKVSVSSIYECYLGCLKEKCKKVPLAQSLDISRQRRHVGTFCPWYISQTRLLCIIAHE
jgi:hypothetical protein